MCCMFLCWNSIIEKFCFWLNYREFSRAFRHILTAYRDGINQLRKILRYRDDMWMDVLQMFSQALSSAFSLVQLSFVLLGKSQVKLKPKLPFDCLHICPWKRSNCDLSEIWPPHLTVIFFFALSLLEYWYPRIPKRYSGSHLSLGKFVTLFPMYLKETYDDFLV